MNFNTPVLDVDYTGTNPDNYVTNEPHQLSDRANRVVVPRKGPFFSTTLKIFDNGTQLLRGRDYQLPEIHSFLTSKTKQEVSKNILIINPLVSSNVTIEYRAVGGHYANQNEAIANMFETLINDHRVVHWENIANKEKAFQPVNHKHILDDVIGFEYIVDYLERIRNAITVGQTSVVLEIIEALIGPFKPGAELPKILPTKKSLQYDALLYFLSKRKILSNISLDVYDWKWTEGGVNTFEVDTTDYPVGETLHWEIYLEGGKNVYFINNNKGTLVSNGGIVRVEVYTPLSNSNKDTYFYIGVKKNPDDDEFMAVSYSTYLYAPPAASSDYARLLLNLDAKPLFYLRAAAYAQNDELRLWYLTQHH